MKINQILKNEWPWKKLCWEERTEAIAKIIPPEASIIELGGGMCFLKTILKDNKYISVDLREWTDLTIMADFNKGEFPDTGLFDIIVCQGVLEYIGLCHEFLKAIHKYGRRLIISYYTGDKNIETRMNNFNFEEVEELLKKAGWQKIFENKLKEDQKIFICVNDY